MPEIKVFRPESESIHEFIERFKTQNYLAMQKSDDDKYKAMLLANAIPVDILTDIQRRLKPKLLSAATYEEIERHLTEMHSTKKSVIGASVAFMNRKQLSSETIENYAKTLNELASLCNYTECCRDRLIRDRFVSGLNN